MTAHRKSARCFVPLRPGIVRPNGEALTRASIERDEVFVTNVVKHFKWKPGTDSKPCHHAKPRRREVAACLPWFEAETRRVLPDVIVCLGVTASKALLSDATSK
jgi:uracil-DNA glycosylase